MKAFTITLTVACSDAAYADLLKEAQNEGFSDHLEYLKDQFAGEFDADGLIVETMFAENLEFVIQT